MKLSKNEIDIIKLLISSPNYITTYDIANSTGINRRVVRDEMNHIKTFLNELGWTINVKVSKGYLLIKKSCSDLEKLQEMIESYEQEREYLIPNLPEDRRSFIINKLIEINDYIKIDDIADELLVSRSTITKDICIVKKTIQKYNLCIKQKPNYGIRICGHEVDLRKPLCDSLFTNLQNSQMFYNYLDNFLTDSLTLEHGIIKIIKKYDIKIDDIALCDFLINCLVGVMRIVKGYSIMSEPNDYQYIKDTKEMKVAKEITDYISNKSSIEYNEYETINIGKLLICKSYSYNHYFYQENQVKEIVNDILLNIEKETCIRFDNEDFIDYFSQYVNNALIRIKYNEKIRTPLFLDVITNTPLAYGLAYITSDIFKKHVNKSFSRSELAAFAGFFNTELLKMQATKFKVLLISGLGGTYFDLLQLRLNESLSHKINIIKITNYYQLSNEDLHQYDLIISTVPIHKKLSIPHIHISHMVTLDDLNKVNSYISNISYKYKFKYYFHPSLYLDHIKYKQKNKIIDLIYKTLKKVYPNLNDSIIHILKTNQYIFSCIQEKIGIISLTKPINANPNIVIHVFDEPIHWQQHDLSILILYSCIDKNGYIYNHLYNALENIINHQTEYDRFIENPSYHSFLQLLISHLN